MSQPMFGDHDIPTKLFICNSRLAQLVERVTSNDEVSRSSRLMGMSISRRSFYLSDGYAPADCYQYQNPTLFAAHYFHF